MEKITETYLSRIFSDLLVLSNIDELERMVREEEEEVMRANYNSGAPSTVPPGILQDKSKRYYFLETLWPGRGEAYVFPLDLNVGNGQIETPYKPLMRFGIPVFAPDGGKRGVLALNFLGDRLLGDLAGANKSKGGQVMVLNATGCRLKGPKPDQEWGFMFEEKTDLTLPASYPEAWRVISGKPSGQLSLEEGLFSIATVAPQEEHLAGSNVLLQARGEPPFVCRLVVHPRSAY